MLTYIVVDPICQLDSSLSVGRFLENRFDVNDRGAVQRLQWTPPESPLHVNLQNLNAMQAYRVWAVRQTRCKNPSKRVLRVVARMEL